MDKFGKIVVCGVGLIGGSFALALKRAGLGDQVGGMGRSRATLERAQALGVIDVIGADWSSALQGADLVLLGMPVGQMQTVLTELAPHLEPATVVTDAGSTKADVVAAAKAGMGNRLAQFVPGHPIAGTEKSGPEAAFAELYDGRRTILTPLPENAPAAVDRVRRAWEACGAMVSLQDAATHDRLFAAVSHLPHLLAYAMVHNIVNRDNADQLFGFAAGGFRDFTRLASSHPEMWRDISLSNRSALLSELDAYMAELLRLRVLLASADGAGLEWMLETSRRARDAWLQTLQSPSVE